MTAYISGPMTGIKQNNIPAFVKAKEELIALGHRVKSPSDVTYKENYYEYMKADIKLLLDCDFIVMLDGWEKSRGACMEKQIADFLLMPSYILINGELNAL